MRYVEVDEVKNLKVLADRSSIEVFVNDGEVCNFRQDIIRKIINYWQKRGSIDQIVRNYVTKYGSKILIIRE